MRDHVTADGRDITAYVGRCETRGDANQPEHAQADRNR